MPTRTIWVAAILVCCYFHDTNGFQWHQFGAVKPAITQRHHIKILSNTAKPIATRTITNSSPSMMLSSFMKASIKGKIVFVAHSTAIVMVAWLLKYLFVSLKPLLESLIGKIVTTFSARGGTAVVEVSTKTKKKNLEEVPAGIDNKPASIVDIITAPSSEAHVENNSSDSNSATTKESGSVGKEFPERKREKGWDWNPSQVPPNTPTYQTARYRLNYIPKERGVRVASVPIVNKGKDEMSDADARATAKTIADLLP